MFVPRFTWSAIALCVAHFFFLAPNAFAQGSLSPPGTPAPTMKSLDQVEARTIVNSTNAAGDATHQFIISAAGSYYLTGNTAVVSAKHGIEINADNVTLDLNGFALVGPGSSNGALSAIVVVGARRNVRIRNGSAQSWGAVGIDCNNASNSQFDHLRVTTCGAGFRCGSGNTVTEVSADGNPGIGINTGTNCRLVACSATNDNPGFQVGSNCTVTASTASNNSGTGLVTGDGCTIIGCTANNNTTRGIDAGSNCVVKDCTAYHNLTIGIKCVSSGLIAECVANLNGTTIVTDSGISPGNHGTVKHCVTYSNTGSGIRAIGDSVLLENQCNNNSGDGINASGSLNRIDSNHTNGNTGIGINAGNDWIVRNTAGSNSGGNIVGAGTDIGPTEAASTATHPFANMP